MLESKQEVTNVASLVSNGLKSPGSASPLNEYFIMNMYMTGKLLLVGWQKTIQTIGLMKKK